MAGIDLDFLKCYPNGTAAITVLTPDGFVSRVQGLSPVVIGDKCPLLYYALDDGPNGDYRASIEASSLDIIVSLCRFLYTGTYLSAAEEDVPGSLLKHVELYKLARDYDLPDLEAAASFGFLQEVEMACCVPDAPAKLCETIRFIFAHLADRVPLVDTLLNYCVNSFKYHGLGNDPDFRKAAFDIPAFHQGLCQTSFKRNFQDEGAAEIVCLPVCESNPRAIVLKNADLNVDKRSHAEFQFEEWYDSQRAAGACDDEANTLATTEPKMSRTAGARPDSPLSDHSPTALPLRTKDLNAQERFSKRRRTVTESDFTLVYRPKQGDDAKVLSEPETMSDDEWVAVGARPRGLQPAAQHTDMASELPASPASSSDCGTTSPFLENPSSSPVSPRETGDDETLDALLENFARGVDTWSPLGRASSTAEVPAIPLATNNPSAPTAKPVEDEELMFNIDAVSDTSSRPEDASNGGNESDWSVV